MTLYSNPTDAASHAVRFVLSEKAINIEIRTVTQDNRPEELDALNPYGDTLTLVDRELVLYEPQIIMEYLDERFPHPPLMPVDPVARASNRLLRYRLARDVYALINVIEAGKADAAAKARKGLRDQLSAVAPAFAQMPFFMSDEYTLVDCFLTPILWRLPHLHIKLPTQAKALTDYATRMFERPAFDASLTEAEREMHEA
ncbi:MAG: glutathione binding-like protein [Gammaproteobacteria bacterium]